MDNKKQKNAVTNEIGTSEELITRNEAVKKVAKYMAITALSTFIILNPKKAQAQSGGPGGPGFGG
ncbi:hypothetical protein [Polaribacter gochangensis]|uniref:hypothetical protein n=1 Tax=Polaribacter gochangensis TaxID=3252903 RepID=UPI003904D205